jgi:predicted RNA binding protein YcfA (HicA-like mRNA interferase family)
MKKLPRNLSATDLIRELKKMGYTKTRQVGSHIRITTNEGGIHHITIPEHNPLRIVTL